MPIHNIVEEMLSDSRERRIEELESSLEEMRTLIEGLQAHIEITEGESVRINAPEITIRADANLRLEAGAQITLDGSMLSITTSTVTCNSPMATFSGVVRCETIIATTVNGASYTPGAGNVW